ncbi:LacI family transcriptional regulator [Clostridia bacterium]|nr:LacI family transcriptional regulator [Clostridia bacterium]
MSYVLNNTPSQTISKETVDKVLDAVQRLGYVPNQAAQTLGASKLQKKGSSKLIGIVIPQTEPGKEFVFSNPFYGDFLSAVEYTARINGYQILISGTAVDQSYVEIAKSRSLDGVIIVGMYPSSQIGEFKKMQTPIVMVDYCRSDHFFHNIGINDRYGGYLATHYLTERGHRKIAFVSGFVQDYGVNFERLLGYRDALNEEGIEYDENLMFTGNVGYEYGFKAAEQMAKRKNVTAVFVTADIIAVGLIKGLHKIGLRVPEDVSVIGFDDIYLAQLSEPSLTTVRQDITKKGEAAIKLIIDNVKDSQLPRRDISIPLKIVERESVADLKK